MLPLYANFRETHSKTAAPSEMATFLLSLSTSVAARRPTAYCLLTSDFPIPLFAHTLSGKMMHGPKAAAKSSRNPRPVAPSFRATSRSTWEILRRVAVYLRPYKLMAAGTIGCALLVAGLRPGLPQADPVRHRRRDRPETRGPAHADDAGTARRLSAARPLQQPAHPHQQHLRAERHLRHAPRCLCPPAAPAGELFRPARFGRPDDPRDRGRELRRARADRRHRARHRGDA